MDPILTTISPDEDTAPKRWVMNSNLNTRIYIIRRTLHVLYIIYIIYI